MVYFDYYWHSLMRLSNQSKLGSPSVHAYYYYYYFILCYSFPMVEDDTVHSFTQYLSYFYSVSHLEHLITLDSQLQRNNIYVHSPLKLGIYIDYWHYMVCLYLLLFRSLIRTCKCVCVRACVSVTNGFPFSLHGGLANVCFHNFLPRVLSHAGGAVVPGM